MKPESEFMTELNRRAMLLFGGGLAAVGLGTLAADAKKKKKKKKRKKRSQRNHGQASFSLCL